MKANALTKFKKSVNKLRECMTKANLKISNPEMNVLENRLEKFRKLNREKIPQMMSAEELDNSDGRISAKDLLKQIGVS